MEFHRRTFRNDVKFLPIYVAATITKSVSVSTISRSKEKEIFRHLWSFVAGGVKNVDKSPPGGRVLPINRLMGMVPLHKVAFSRVNWGRKFLQVGI